MTHRQKQQIPASELWDLLFYIDRMIDVCDHEMENSQGVKHEAWHKGNRYAAKLIRTQLQTILHPGSKLKGLKL